jgi:hypothetical protein
MCGTTLSYTFNIILIDRFTGALKVVSMNNVTVNLSQSWGYYTSFDFNQGDKPVDKEAGGETQVRVQKLPVPIHDVCAGHVALTNFRFKHSMQNRTRERIFSGQPSPIRN